MSHLNKLFYIFIWILLFACNSSEKRQGLNTDPSEADFFKIIKKEIGIELYNSVRHKMIDSLKDWQQNNLKAYMSLNLYNHKVDTILCFNGQKDRVVSALLYQFPGYAQDNIVMFYGVKISSKWYFFQGPAYIIQHLTYGNPKDVPLSFEKLHEQALKKVFRGYLKKNKGEEWEINERFFNQMINKNNPDAIGDGPKGGYGSCFHCKTFEEYVLYLSAENWKDRDTTNAATPVLDQ